MSETETKQAFTAGPWEVDTSKASKRIITVFSGRTDLAGMLGRHDPSVEPMIADAYMMAAAPDMLAACEAAEQCITDFLEIYKHGAAMVAMDEAVKSLRDDALRLCKIALKKAEAPQ